MMRFFKKTDLRPEDVDLRYVRRVQMSDAWDGESTCHDGTTTDAILYKLEVVSKTHAERVGGSVEVRTRTEDPFWAKMAALADAYMTVVCDLRRQWGFHDGEGNGTVYMYHDTHDLFLQHPQSKELFSGDFGLKLESLGGNEYKIVATKKMRDVA